MGSEFCDIRILGYVKASAAFNPDTASGCQNDGLGIYVDMLPTEIMKKL